MSDPLNGKKVVFVTHSDTLGGAAIVTYRLFQALRRKGVDARMVVYTKTSGEDGIEEVSNRFRRGVGFVLERLHIAAAMSFKRDNLFKVSTGRFAVNLDKHPWVQEADIISLGWFNQGLLSLDGIRRLHDAGKKIVWTLHDMWAFTGICHHAHECDYFRDTCGNCMYLAGGGYAGDLSEKMWNKKKALYEEVPITFVTVSHWLEQKARESSLLRSLPVMTIHNPFPTDQFYTAPQVQVDSLLTDTKPNLILMVAARLDDPIKGLPYAIEALNKIFDNHPDVANNTAVYLIGVLKNPSALDSLRMSYRWLGRVNDFNILTYLYASARAVISTSLYESLPGTLIEGQAAGALPVTFGNGGQSDIITHKVNGYIARYLDTDDFAEGILWALNENVDRDALHRSVEDRFGADIIADKYIDLYKSL